MTTPSSISPTRITPTPSFWSSQLAAHRRSKLNRKGKRVRRATTRRRFFEPLEDRRVLATIAVTSLTDDTLQNLSGDREVSLREAIEAANTNASVDGSTAGSATEADTIEFQAGLTGSINLSGTELRITDGVTITGPGRDLLTIDAQQNSRIFNVIRPREDVTIDGLTMTNGRTTGDNAFGEDTHNGGAIRFDAADADNVTVNGFIKTWLHLGPFDQPNGAAPSEEQIRADYLTDGTTGEDAFDFADGATMGTNFATAASSGVQSDWRAQPKRTADGDAQHG